MYNLDTLPAWAFNVLEVYNYKLNGPYAYWYDFLQYGLKTIPGDVIEVGVFRGRTFAATAHLCAKLSPPRSVIGFDTFGGFPCVDNPYDQPSQFDQLLCSGSISQHHYEQIHLNKALLEQKNVAFSVASSSSSKNFSGTSLQLVQKKMQNLMLDNYRLIPGSTSQTMIPENLPKTISAIFLDADLYEPYVSTLNACWNRLSRGGIVFLDEYYSLKFPGPRIATEQFIESHIDARLICISRPFNDFERWILLKD